MGMFAASCISDWLESGRFPLRVYDLAAIVPALWKVEPALFDPHSAARLDPAFDISWGVLFGVLVILCSHDAAARKVLAFPVLVWAGEISYSVYLVHGHVLLGMIHVLKASKCSVVTFAAAEIFIMVPLSFGVGVTSSSGFLKDRFFHGVVRSLLVKQPAAGGAGVVKAQGNGWRN